MEEATTDLFINLIQNNPIIYNKTLKDFKNIRKKEEVWASIAHQSRMTVEAAKRRYFSLRQKFCREKRHSEVKRRNKQVHRNSWIYYERLSFLNPFIQPRATFTNDTGFVEDDTVAENGLEDCDDPAMESQDIEIETDDGVDVNEISALLGGDPTSSQTFDDSNAMVQEVRSEYTGDVSQIVFFSRPPQDGTLLVNSDNEAAQETEETQPEVISDQDNYMSQHPSSSRQHQSSATGRASVLPARISAAVGSENNTSLACRSVGSQLPKTDNRSTILSNRSVSSSQQQTSSRLAPTLTHAPKTTSNVTPLKTAPTHTVTGTASVPNDKSIESIRCKMDYCLNAVTNTMTNRQQRSPHAPFLAYLGTKLVNVPKELISNLEQEILDLVKLHSKPFCIMIARSTYLLMSGSLKENIICYSKTSICICSQIEVYSDNFN